MDAVGVIQLIIIIILITVTAIGNGTMVICICITHQLHNPASYIVLSLAVADLLVGIWLLPFSIPAVVNQNWTIGTAMCMVNGFTNHVLSVASILGLFAISIDRYISIFYPLNYPEYMTSKRAVLLIAFTWSYAAITAIFPLVGWAQYRFAKGIWLCITDFTASISFSYFIIITVYAIPLTALTVIYYRIFKIAYHHARAIEHQTCSQKQDVDDMTSYPTIKNWLNNESSPSTIAIATNGVESIESHSNAHKLSNVSTYGSTLQLTKTMHGTFQSSENCANGPRPRMASLQPDFQSTPITLTPKQNRKKPNSRQTRKKKKLLKFKKEIRTGLILAIIVMIFVVSWSPFAILNLWALHTGKEATITAEAIVSRFAYMNSAINPPLYCLMNKFLRRSMKKLWYRVFKALRIDKYCKFLRSSDEDTSFEMTMK